MAGKGFPAISTCHFPLLRKASSTGTFGSIITRPTAPPRVWAYDLGVEHERLGILHKHLDEAARQRALGLLSEHRFLANEAAGFLEIKRKTEARFVRHVGVVDVVAVVAVTLFHAQT